MIDVKVITGCRTTYRQKHGMPTVSGILYLKQCIDSIILSDIDVKNLTIYNDLLGDSLEIQSNEHKDTITYIERYLSVKVVHNRGGNTNHNFIESITDFNPSFSHTLILEDDVIVNRRIISRANQWVQNNDIVFGTLYNAGGWQDKVNCNSFWGGQALILKNSYIPKFIYAFHNYDEILPSCQKGWIDIMFSRIAGNYLRVPIWVHNPSLVQHIGYISGWTTRGLHTTNNFLNE